MSFIQSTPSQAAPATIIVAGLKPVHKGSPEQQKYIDYAWEISYDRNFIYLLKSENGYISPDRRSLGRGLNGYYDYGFCQMNKGFHFEKVTDKRFFTDWKWQLEQCVALYRGGTTFYGLKRYFSNSTFRQSIQASFDWK